MLLRGPGYPEGLNHVTPNIPASYRIPAVTLKALLIAVITKGSQMLPKRPQLPPARWASAVAKVSDVTHRILVYPKGLSCVTDRVSAFIQRVSAVNKTSAGPEASDVH